VFKYWAIFLSYRERERERAREKDRKRQTRVLHSKSASISDARKGDFETDARSKMGYFDGCTQRTCVQRMRPNPGCMQSASRMRATPLIGQDTEDAGAVYSTTGRSISISRTGWTVVGADGPMHATRR